MPLLLRFLAPLCLLPLLANAQWQAPPFLISPPAEQVTSRGQNRNALFLSSDEILFVSRDRKRNQDPQIYLKSLQNGYEQPITHQRGQIELGSLLERKQGLFYSSTTDEEKESPLVLRPYLDRFPSAVDTGPFVFFDFSPQEIYFARLDGSGIQRLSQNAGFDGFPTVHPHQQQVYYSRWHNSQLKIFVSPLQGGAGNPLWSLSKSEGHDLGLKWHNSGKEAVWSRFSPDFSSAQLMIGRNQFKKVDPLTSSPGWHWGAQFHPNGESLVFSAKRPDMTNYDLFEISHDGRCERQISSYEGDEYLPTVSPDGKRILFTSTHSGSEQIFSIPYPSSPLTCP